MTHIEKLAGTSTGAAHDPANDSPIGHFIHSRGTGPSILESGELESRARASVNYQELAAEIATQLRRSWSASERESRPHVSINSQELAAEIATQLRQDRRDSELGPSGGLATVPEVSGIESSGAGPSRVDSSQCRLRGSRRRWILCRRMQLDPLVKIRFGPHYHCYTFGVMAKLISGQGEFSL